MKFLDGTILEGGGQRIYYRRATDVVLRNSAAYACILGQEINVYNIRLNRRDPGLKDQHLQGLVLLCKLSSGRLMGATIGSREITFRPGLGNECVQFSAKCKG
jgi:RNA 3'-terminal phosphate cyclase